MYKNKAESVNSSSGTDRSIDETINGTSLNEPHFQSQLAIDRLVKLKAN